MKKIIVFLSLILFLAQCSTEVITKETAQWRGPDRNGLYPESDLLDVWPDEGPALAWEYNELGAGYASVAVADDIVYTSGTIDSIGYLFAFDVNGTLLWKKPYGDEWMENFPGIRSTPLVYDGKVYLLSGVGDLLCFDATTGEIKWLVKLFEKTDGKNVRFGICENLVFDKERIYATPGGEKENVIALDKDSGVILWTSKGNGEESAYCSPRLIQHNDKQYFISMTRYSVIAVDTETGDLAWSYPLNEKLDVHANTPYYQDGHLLVMDGFESGSFMLKIADDGQAVEEVWRNDLLDETNGACVVVDDDIYVSAESAKKFCCVDWNTGNINYSIDTLAPSTVIMADGMLYCCTYRGEFGLMKPGENGFELKSTFKYPKSKIMYITHPVIKDGKMYVRHDKSLKVYGLSNS